MKTLQCFIMTLKTKAKTHPRLRRLGVPWPLLICYHFSFLARHRPHSTLFTPRADPANSCLQAFALASSSAHPATAVLHGAPTLSSKSQLMSPPETGLP